jgi:hypothetical protein
MEKPFEVLLIVVAHARVNLEDYPGGKSTNWHRLGQANWRSFYAAPLWLVDAVACSTSSTIKLRKVVSTHNSKHMYEKAQFEDLILCTTRDLSFIVR